MKEVKIRMGKRRVIFMADGRKWRLPGLLYTNDLVLCSELEEDLRAMMGRFLKVRRRKGLKVNEFRGRIGV